MSKPTSIKMNKRFFSLFKALLVLLPWYGPVLYNIIKAEYQEMGDHFQRFEWGVVNSVQLIVDYGWAKVIMIPLLFSILISKAINFYAKKLGRDSTQNPSFPAQ